MLAEDRDNYTLLGDTCSDFTGAVPTVCAVDIVVGALEPLCELNHEALCFVVSCQLQYCRVTCLRHLKLQFHSFSLMQVIDKSD